MLVAAYSNVPWRPSRSPATGGHGLGCSSGYKSSESPVLVSRLCLPFRLGFSRLERSFQSHGPAMRQTEGPEPLLVM